MTTFWGCDTTDMDTWAALATTEVRALTDLLDALAATGPTLAWSGPDAQRFQSDLSACLLGGYRIGRLLARYCERLQEEAQQQEEASSPDGGSGTGGSSPGGTPVSGTPVSGTPSTGTPGGRPLLGTGPGGPLGPMIHPDPAGLARRLGEKVEALDFRSPWWDPHLARPFGPMAPIPVLRDTGAEAPDVSITADGEAVRSAGAKHVPGLKQVQAMMGAHEWIGGGIDRLESGMQDAGYGQYTGVLAPAKVMHGITGMAIGEDSVPGQILGAADAQIANTYHSAGAVSSRILDGDLLGAAREAEMGVLRHAESQIDLVTASPLRAVAGFASDSLETGADVLDPIAPPAVSQRLRGAAGSIDSHVAAWDEATSAQRFLDLRYRYVPTPWDQPS